MKTWPTPVSVFERLMLACADLESRLVNEPNPHRSTTARDLVLRAFGSNPGDWEPPKFDLMYDAEHHSLELRFFDPHTGERVRLETAMHGYRFQATQPKGWRDKYEGQPDHASAGWRPE